MAKSQIIFNSISAKTRIVKFTTLWVWSEINWEFWIKTKFHISPQNALQWEFTLLKIKSKGKTLFLGAFLSNFFARHIGQKWKICAITINKHCMITSKIKINIFWNFSVTVHCPVCLQYTPITFLKDFITHCARWVHFSLPVDSIPRRINC